MQHSAVSWEVGVILECDVGKAERHRRRRVGDARDDKDTPMGDRFAEAPYIHPYNVPKYMAAALRSQNFARPVKRPVLWVMARDTPVTDADKSLKGEALHRARERW